MNCFDVMRKLTVDYLKNFNYNLEDQKIISYLKVVLMGDFTVLDNLTNSVYSFSYKYNLTDTPINGVYYGTTDLQFTYFNTTVKVYYRKENYETPLLFVNKYYQSIENILFNIDIKLTTGMPDYEFEKTVNKSRIPILKINELKDFENLKKKYKLTHVVRKYEDYNQIIKINDIKESDNIYPIFLTTEVLRRGGDKHMDMYEARPNCDEQLLSVYLGKSKIYTLPFWKCNQHDNMIYNGDLQLDDIPLNIYLTNRRLERYIKNKTEKVTDIINLPEISLKKLNTKIINEIKKQKIYDINFNTIVDVEKIPVELSDLLLIAPINIKTYEKKNILFLKAPIWKRKFSIMIAFLKKEEKKKRKMNHNHF